LNTFALSCCTLVHTQLAVGFTVHQRAAMLYNLQYDCFAFFLFRNLVK